MSPLNRGPLRIPPAGMRPPVYPRFGRMPPPPLPSHVMSRGVPPPMFGPRGRPIPPRPGSMIARPGPPAGPPMFGPGDRHMPPMPPMPPALPPMPPMPPRMGLRGPMGPHGPMMRPGPSGIIPPHALPHMRPRFPLSHLNGKGKMNNNKKTNKLEELELKKPWMTDDIRSEIQKKNKLYAKAKKNKDAKEWEEFKDLRNKVTRMIRDAKNEYLAKNPEQAHLYKNDEPYGECYNDDIDELYAESEDESSSPYCEVCDREFSSEELLEKHIKEHETCSIDGCTFTAHPKIVEKHISMQHYTGLYQRMKSVLSDEDIEKWKAERKRRYPTTANIKLQEDERLEKEKRGEVIKRQNGKARGTLKRGLRKTRKRKFNKPLQKDNEEESVEPQIYRGLLPFAGTAMLDTYKEEIEIPPVNEIKIQDECKFDIVDDDDQFVHNSPTNENIKPKDSIPSGFSLVADYGTDSDNDEPPDEIPIKISRLNEDVVPEVVESQNKLTEATNNSQTSLHDEKALSKSKDDNKSISDSKSRKKKIIKEDRQKLRRPFKENKSEYNNGRLRLLNQLLARSIQHERNVICQCITFMANNNFFD